MTNYRIRRAALLFAAAALAPLAQAQAAPCPTVGAAPLTLGTVSDVAPGGVRSYSLELNANQGVIVDVVKVVAPKPVAASHDDEEGDSHPAPAVVEHTIRLCDAKGIQLAPDKGEVFEKGGSITSTDDGERLQFLAPVSGQYIVTVAASDEAREVLARRREVGVAKSPVISAALDSSQKGIVSSKAPMVYSFSGTAGQWVVFKSTSEKDTLLRLAAPDRDGNYSVLVENDDSDGLNPVIRRKLPVTGTYFLQVDSLADEPGDFELTLNKTDAPKPPPPPAALRLGTSATGKLADEDDVKLYSLGVVSGHSYQLELTANYDGVVAIGLPNPVEPDNADDKADSMFSEVKSQDANLTGTEKLTFVARSSGQLLVRVKSFGIGETDGSYTLKALDVGN
jgi:hypothetical protein